MWECIEAGAQPSNRKAQECNGEQNEGHTLREICHCRSDSTTPVYPAVVLLVQRAAWDAQRNGKFMARSPEITWLPWETSLQSNLQINSHSISKVNPWPCQLCQLSQKTSWGAVSWFPPHAFSECWPCAKYCSWSDLQWWKKWTKVSTHMEVTF